MTPLAKHASTGTSCGEARNIGRLAWPQMVPRLSVVIPVFNEPDWIGSTVADLVIAVRNSGLTDVELVIVDDGSDTPTQVVLAELDVPFAKKVLRQENMGRLLARKHGVDASTGELILLLDSRVSLHPHALEFVVSQMTAADRLPIWTAHVEYDHGRSPYGRIWSVLEFMAWRDYLADPRPVTYTIADYDRFPKGTTCFIAPRSLLLEAMSAFESHYENLREVNDDTAVLRPLAAKQEFNLAPGFSCTYHPRATARKFFRHALHRGVVFIDGYGRPGSRFFWVIVAFYPLSALSALVALKRPRIILGALPAAPLAGLWVRFKLRRPTADAAAVGVLGPVWLVAYAMGMWRGAALAAAKRIRPATRR